MAANLSAVMDDTDKVQSSTTTRVRNGSEDRAARHQRRAPIASCRSTRSTSATAWAAVKGTGAGRDRQHRRRARGRRAVPRPRRFLPARRPARGEPPRDGGADQGRAPSTSLEPNRASLAASLGDAIEAAEKGEQFANQTSLFGGGDAAARGLRPSSPPAPWCERERLLNEKQSLGFYLSGPPVQRLSRTSCGASRARRSRNRAHRIDTGDARRRDLRRARCATPAAAAWRSSRSTMAPRAWRWWCSASSSTRSAR